MSTSEAIVCPACQKSYRPGKEPDPCLGWIEGLRNACCGHGCDSQRYANVESQVTLRGRKADELLGQPVIERDPQPDFDYSEVVIVSSVIEVPEEEIHPSWSEFRVLDHMFMDGDLWGEILETTTRRIIKAKKWWCLGAARVRMTKAQAASYQGERVCNQNYLRSWDDENQAIANLMDEAERLFAQ